MARQWLTIVSWVAVILGLLDRARDRVRCHSSPSPAHEDRMNVVWPITGLYLSGSSRLVALYADMARRKPMSMVYGHCMLTGTAAVRSGKSVFVSDDTLRSGLRYWRHHDGAPIVFWAGWTLFGSRLFAGVFGSFCSRLYFWYRVPIPSDPRHALADFRGATRSLKRSRPTHSLQRSRLVRLTDNEPFIYFSVRYRGPS